MNGKRSKVWLLAMVALILGTVSLLAGPPKSEVVTGATVQGHGKFNNSANLLVDGAFVPQKSKFDGAGCVHWSDPNVYFVIDLGAVREIHDLKVSVDNNDNYVIETSMDGSKYKHLVTVRREFGEITWGMDSLSTHQGYGQYANEIDIPFRKARYVKVSANAGDKLYAMSELKIWALPVGEVKPDDQETAEVPKPAGKIKVIANGPHKNEARLLVDGKWAEQHSKWNGKKCVFWNGNDTYFLMDLGSVKKVKEIKVSVDNNDVYQMDYSKDGKTYKPLFTIKRAYGEETWGMDTMATNSKSPEYVKEIDFKAVNARYLKFYAKKGDGHNAASEIKVKTKDVAKK